MIYFKIPSWWRPPSGSAGCANGPFVRIRKGHEDDKGLLAHEVCHVEQFWNNPLFHGLRYRFSKAYRLDCEVKAYREQLQHKHPVYKWNERREMYAGWLSAPGWVEGYDLQDICTKEQAIKLLGG